MKQYYILGILHIPDVLLHYYLLSVVSEFLFFNIRATRKHSSRTPTARFLTPPMDADPPGYRPPDHVTCDACWDTHTP